MHIELAQSQSSRLNKPIVFLGAILVLVFFSYIAALNNDFVNWDDGPHLVDNLSVRSLSLENIKNIFKSTISKTYIPLTTLSWAVEYSFIKYNPFYYHLNNLLLHLANVALIFTLARQIGLSYLASGFASLLWGIHPMHVESVVWVTQRKDVLFTVFYLLGLNSYWRYLKKGRMALYFLTLVFGFLSILAKAMALSFPVVLVLCDYLYRRKKSLGLILEKVPFFCYVIPITWITLSANTNIMAVDQNFGQSILTFLWTFIFYLKKFAWPQWLGPAYTLPDPISLGNSAFLISVIGFVLLLGAIIVFRRKKLFIFSLFFYSVTIFPILRYE
ncbi:MAG: hypothetical protein KC733_12400, partial [Candidatus Omnitrophica bacterium]|nr:hypothetical protein [Candidatus Omnitrophota bacterium]